MRLIQIICFLLASAGAGNGHCRDNFKEDGGQYVRENAPWSCRIFIGDKMMGSGVVLGDNIVATAAHVLGKCYDLSSVTIRVGWNDYDDPKISVGVLKILSPSTFNCFDKRTDNEIQDVALLVTESPIRISEDSRLSLPTKDQLKDLDLLSNPAYLISWGLISEGCLPATAKNISVLLNTFCTSYTEDIFCGDVQQGDGFTCPGDSGGPLIVYSKERPLLIGLLLQGEHNSCVSTNLQNKFMGSSIIKALLDTILEGRNSGGILTMSTFASVLSMTLLLLSHFT